MSATSQWSGLKDDSSARTNRTTAAQDHRYVAGGESGHQLIEPGELAG